MPGFLVFICHMFPWDMQGGDGSHMVEKRQVYRATYGQPQPPGSLKNICFANLAHQFSIDQKSLFVGIFKLEMLLKC